MAPLPRLYLNKVVAGLAQMLEEMDIDYALMGGAAVCLLVYDATRMTEDVDIVINVDHRNITTDQLITQLIQRYPSDIAPITQFGYTIPAYKLILPKGQVQLVEIEIFDYQSWPQRPQYDISRARRKTLQVNGQVVKVFSNEWIFREKVLCQYQRQGSDKEGTDIWDITSLLLYLERGKPELDFDRDRDLTAALQNLLEKRPGLAPRLKEVVKCSAVFGEWYTSEWGHCCGY
ncbi:hypothetical protein ASPCADRAFT_8826 [Aspergillus carbonarius ITEM 5010]|uniref:Nucleotidyl transferase AbiEii/AbiGii toxin family protein n=1 Tax=Aspergillus carbonarius (strain ITEM 5010) TaxID=602072 RepID=A0A1R3RDJ1_ASPC5|nr:hypothetical protein ASPCADRAFT_8826 [Aspergillus carbonarius ITEM 5010]